LGHGAGVTTHDRFHHLGAQNIALAPYHLFGDHQSGQAWLNWSNPEALMRFIYYGASVEFFFVMLTTFLVITALGDSGNARFLWGCVRGLETMANVIGRTAAWAGLIMVLIQVMIVFPAAHLPRGRNRAWAPWARPSAFDLSWWAEG
jgi:hypothetical protein